MRVSAFWDSSALVPLCVRQRVTPQTIALFKNHNVVIWWATPVEMASALARLVRMQQIDSAECSRARKLAHDLANAWSVIQPSATLRVKAMQLAERYDLRAAGSLQLAAALEWCEDSPQGHIFLTVDQKLREAALLAGFDDKPIP